MTVTPRTPRRRVRGRGRGNRSPVRRKVDGAGVTRYRPAIVWGTITTMGGSLLSRLNVRTLRDFAIAWTLTPLTAGLIATGISLLLG